LSYIRWSGRTLAILSASFLRSSSPCTTASSACCNTIHEHASQNHSHSTLNTGQFRLLSEQHNRRCSHEQHPYFIETTTCRLNIAAFPTLQHCSRHACHQQLALTTSCNSVQHKHNCRNSMAGRETCFEKQVRVGDTDGRWGGGSGKEKASCLVCIVSDSVGRGMREHDTRAEHARVGRSGLKL